MGRSEEKRPDGRQPWFRANGFKRFENVASNTPLMLAGKPLDRNLEPKFGQPITCLPFREKRLAAGAGQPFTKIRMLNAVRPGVLGSGLVLKGIFHPANLV